MSNIIIIPGRPGRPIVIDRGGRIPGGGIEGQSLVKSSDLDYATEWATVTGAPGYATRAGLVSANTATPGLGLADGQIVRAAGLEYRRLAASAAITDLPGWVPNGPTTPFHFGAVGDGVTDDRPALVLLNTYGGDVYMPKPPVSYTVSSAINLDKPGITADPTCSWEALTDSGQITWNQNLFTEIDTPPAPIHRFSGRVFLGDAAHEMAGGWETGAPDGTDDRGPEAWYADGGGSLIFGGYTHRDATMAIANGNGTTALAVSTRASDQWNPAWDAPIGVASFVHNDGNGEAWSSVWAHIVEGRASQLQGNTLAMEVALGNISGVTKTIDPYNWNTGDGGGVHGFWMAGAGDASIGTPSNAPNNSPMVVLKNESNVGLDGGWSTGIVFTEDALLGTNGSATSTTFATAISMGRNQKVQWYEPTTGERAFSITSIYTSVTDAARLEGFANGGVYGLNLRRESDGLSGIILRSTTGNINTHAVLQAEPTTVSFRAEGSVANANIFLVPKGTGRVRFGAYSAIADVPITGYIEILDSGGNVRRLAVVA